MSFDAAYRAARANLDVAIEDDWQPAPARRQLVPTEAEAHMAIVAWCKQMESRWPELRWLTHVPNGEYRPAHVGAKLKRMGTRPGVPDLMLFVPRGGYVGLAVEVKRANRSNHTTDAQDEWLAQLAAMGWRCEVVYGAAAGTNVIREYMEGEK